jgi:hypothetical protein
MAEQVDAAVKQVESAGFQAPLNHAGSQPGIE